MTSRETESPQRAAFVGGIMHGRMWFVPELASVLHVPVGPDPDAKVQHYVRQNQLEFTSFRDDYPTACYFIAGLSGRSVESLRLDLLWPEGWDYAETS